MTSLSPEVVAVFPNLFFEQHRVTSCETGTYNCFAWALGEDFRRWEARARVRGYFWPYGFPRDHKLTTFLGIFAAHDYRICGTSQVERGYEKVALYGTAERITHASRQLLTGRWTSKMGDAEDIEHSTAKSIADGFYGPLVVVMSRLTAGRRIDPLIRGAPSVDTA